jgi:hypothetical protein
LQTFARQLAAVFVVSLSRRDDTDALAVVLQTLFDLALLYGPAPFASADGEGLDAVLLKLRSYLRDGAPAALQEIAAEGFAKLFTADRLADPKVRRLICCLLTVL